MKYEVGNSEPVGSSTHGLPERYESALQTLGAAERRGFWSALSQRSGWPCDEISHGEVEAALFREVG